MTKRLFIIFLFFVISMLQVSFLPHFTLAGWVINIVLISLVVLASFASLATGVQAAVTSGFFLDIYSSLPFGFWIILCLSLFFVMHYILQNYVRLPKYI